MAANNPGTLDELHDITATALHNVFFLSSPRVMYLTYFNQRYTYLERFLTTRLEPRVVGHGYRKVSAQLGGSEHLNSGIAYNVLDQYVLRGDKLWLRFVRNELTILPHEQGDQSTDDSTQRNAASRAQA